MKLKKLQLRYYPPGIILEYLKTNGETEVKSVDLLNLNEETNVEELVDQILQEQSLIPQQKKYYLVELIRKLVSKVTSKNVQNFQLSRRLISHKQPLTNCQFNKYGTKFITGSYDTTCKIWNTETGKIEHTLTGHKGIVYCVAFNNPFGDLVFTGSFDNTCKIWSVESGECLSTLAGH